MYGERRATKERERKGDELILGRSKETGVRDEGRQHQEGEREQERRRGRYENMRCVESYV